MEKAINWDASFFEKNLHLLDPEQRRGDLFPPMQRLEICYSGPQNDLNVREKSSGRFLYFPGGVEDELAYFKESLALDKKQLLIIYGIGLGYYYNVIAPWLRENPTHRAVFIEPDREVMRAFLETDMPEKLFSDPQVEVLFDSQDDYSLWRLETLSRLTFYLNRTFSSLASYAKDRAAHFARFKTQLEFFFNISADSVSEYFYGGSFYFKNYFHNFLHLNECLLADSFFDAFKGVPAIVCGAGPSLEKQIPELLKLKDRALIFAGGTAMNALNAFHFSPHFGAGVDPFEAQMSRILSNEAFMVPYFVKGRMYWPATDAILGDKLYLQGYDGYQIVNWMEAEAGLKPHSPLNLGANIVNMCVSIAHKLGCNPILCVGVDLAYTDGNPYSKGVMVSGIYDPGDKLISKSSREELILAKDIHGKDIYTLHKWMIEALWFSSFAKENPELKLINCTEGGIGFPGIDNMTLKDALDEYLSKDLGVIGRVEQAISKAQGFPVPSSETLISVAKRFLIELKDFLEKIASLNDQQKEEAFNQLLNQQSSLKSLLNDFNKLYQIKEAQSKQRRHPGLKEILIDRNPFFEYVLRITSTALQNAISFKESELEQTVEMRDNPASTGEDRSYYYPQGNLRCRIPLKNGVIDGRFLYYYPNGQLKREIHFREGLRHGLDIYYSRGGKKIIEVSYFKGKPYGIAKEWYPNSVLKKEIRYFTPGTIVEVLYYDPEGKKIATPAGGRDYYEDIIFSGDKLKDSFISLMRTLEKASRQHGVPEEDLVKIREELVVLESLSEKLKKEAGLIPGDYKEPLWKSPQTKDSLTSRLDQVIGPLHKGMEELQNQLKSILDRLKDGDR